MDVFCIKDIPEFVSKKRGNAIALQMRRNNSVKTYSFNELNSMSYAIAEYLLNHNIKKGDSFAILGENRPEWGISYFSIARTGAYIIPIDSMLKEDAIKMILKFSNAKGIFVSPRYLDIIKEIKDELPNLKIIVSMDETDHTYEIAFNEIIEKGKELIKKGSEKYKKVKVDLDDVYVILFTSGTTGTSKGVMLTNRNVSYDVIKSAEFIGVKENDCFISVLPLHHTFESTAGFLLPLTYGCKIAYARSLKPKEIIEDIKESQATIMLGVPLLYEKMLKGIRRAIKASFVKKTVIGSMLGIERITKNVLGMKLGKNMFKGLREKAGLDSLRLMISGGAALKEEVAIGFEEFGFVLFQGYGLTETSPVATINPADKYKHKSIGLPLVGVQIEIDNPNETGEGELKIKGPIIMKGYYKNEEATKEVLRNGWFYTGDIGFKDKDGYFYISGRKKALIVTEAGKNVYPEEIEEKLMESELIEEALVIPMLNKRIGREEVGAIIYPISDLIEQMMNKNDEKCEKILYDKIKKEINRICDGLASYKRIKHFKIRYEEFPKTTTKKIKRYLFNNITIE